MSDCSDANGCGSSSTASRKRARPEAEEFQMQFSPAPDPERPAAPEAPEAPEDSEEADATANDGAQDPDQPFVTNLAAFLTKRYEPPRAAAHSAADVEAEASARYDLQLQRELEESDRYCMLPADAARVTRAAEILEGLPGEMGCEICRFPIALAVDFPVVREFHESWKSFASFSNAEGSSAELAQIFNNTIYKKDHESGGHSNVRQICAAEVFAHRQHSMHLPTGGIDVMNDLIQSTFDAIKHVQETNMWKVRGGVVVMNKEGTDDFLRLNSALRPMMETRQKLLHGLRSAPGAAAESKSGRKNDGGGPAASDHDAMLDLLSGSH